MHTGISGTVIVLDIVAVCLFNLLFPAIIKLVYDWRFVDRFQ